jgi:predicted DNA-binding transcriptional regulator YafY
LRLTAEVLAASSETPRPAPHRQAPRETILAALGQRRQVRLWFHETDHDEVETTKVGIYRLPLIRGRWCLVGRSSLHRQVKLFPVPQIERVELTTDPYTIPPRFNLQRFLAQQGDGDGDGQGSKVVLRFHSRVIPAVEETPWPAPKHLRRHDDGSVDLTLEAGRPVELLPRILGFGADVEVLEPESLRAALSELAARIAQRVVGPRLARIE